MAVTSAPQIPLTTRRLAAVLTGLVSDHSAEFRALVDELASGKRLPVLHNLEGSALALVLATLRTRLKRPILVLTAGIERAEQMVDDLEFYGVDEVHHFPKWEVLPYDEEDLSLEVTSKHLDTYEALAAARRDGKRCPVVVGPVDATMQRVLPEDRLDALTVRFAWGDRVDVAKLAESLDRAGYTREGLVESRGEFSIRNSIIDIYPPNTDDPIRLDLFGDEIESIRKFDVSTQRSLEELGTSVTIAIPGARLKHHVTGHLREGGGLVTLFDLLPPGTLVILDSPERYEEVCAYFQNAVDRQFNEVLHGKSELGPPERLVVPPEQLRGLMERFRLVEHTKLPVDDKASGALTIPFRTAGFDVPSGDVKLWLSQIRKRQGEDFVVVLACDNEGQVHRFDEVLREEGISARVLVSDADAEALRVRGAAEGYPDVLLVVGGVHEGFVLNDARIVVLTDREIFGRYKRRHVYKKIYKGRPLAGSNDIQRGDYVVHVEHGIGQYLGMRQQQLDGRTVDLLELLYAEGNKLLVPVEKIRHVQRYASRDTEEVALDRLGSGRWIKRKKKSREEIEKLAEALVELYARREVARRKPFGEDTAWMREFESAFPYQETPDQLKAITDCKADMMKPRPMDRLVCGDVGYGKTEVAIRAIFKCVQEKRQAAVLVPTTVLGLQHYKTLKERFADYPVRVELMSRFQKPAEIKAAKDGLKTGEVQVVVGTHKLLGKDIEFRDLGLLVIDEEQRFGVKAKERLKEMRSEIDILTLTATPIPRTLYMALSGLRDLSVITTPPPDRHPIRTRIIHWEEEHITEAILRELNRGGQVFFIHNRVHNIAEIVAKLQKIVPHARIGVAHGQMKETELEEQMIKFMEGGYDILVSTTIVESGIDIPNANTIIVNRADAFGLAQLYQLRGRVGREKRRAYAYLIVPRGQAITDTAVKRLAAIEEFTELGAGFNIALRDLEIRGTGNLLGKEQHGLINEIGFELYCDLLAEGVARLRGEDLHDQHDVEIKWPLSSFIPVQYIPVETQRVNFYKRIAVMRRQEEVDELAGELRDRFGEIPSGVQALLDITRLRLAAVRLGATLVDGTGPKVRLTFGVDGATALRPHLAAARTGQKLVANASVESSNALVVAMTGGNALERAEALTAFLNRLLEVMREGK